MDKVEADVWFTGEAQVSVQTTLRCNNRLELKRSNPSLRRSAFTPHNNPQIAAMIRCQMTMPAILWCPRFAFSRKGV